MPHQNPLFLPRQGPPTSVTRTSSGEKTSVFGQNFVNVFPALEHSDSTSSVRNEIAKVSINDKNTLTASIKKIQDRLQRSIINLSEKVDANLLQSKYTQNAISDLYSQLNTLEQYSKDKQQEVKSHIEEITEKFEDEKKAYEINLDVFKKYKDELRTFVTEHIEILNKLLGNLEDLNKDTALESKINSLRKKSDADEKYVGDMKAAIR